MIEKIRRAMKKVNGLNIFYRECGTGGRPMICLHGKYGRGETWYDLMSRYGSRFRVIAPDQRGHGLSDKPIARYAGEDFAADSHELLKALDATPAIVVGHSIGGRNAAYLAALYPHAVKALVIIDAKASGPESLSTIPTHQVPVSDALTGSWPTPYKSYQEALSDLSMRFPRETNVRYFLDNLVESVEGYDFLFSQYAMSAIDVYYQGWLHILKQIQCPVLLVRAESSWYLSRDEVPEMRKLLHNCSCFEVTDSDHMVYVDNPGQFYPVFEDFVMQQA